MLQMNEPDASAPQEGFNLQSDPFGMGPSENNPSSSGDIMSAMNSIPFDNKPMASEVMDEQEMQRIQARQQEEVERRKKIEDKINYELKKKEELREEARKYMDDFQSKKESDIAKRKELNSANEKEFLNNKALIKQGKKNSWEIVTDNIALKESDYKGSNDVSRMRAVIIARKNDQNPGKNDGGLGNLY